MPTAQINHHYIRAKASGTPIDLPRLPEIQKHPIASNNLRLRLLSIRFRPRVPLDLFLGLCRRRRRWRRTRGGFVIGGAFLWNSFSGRPIANGIVLFLDPQGKGIQLQLAHRLHPRKLPFCCCDFLLLRRSDEGENHAAFRNRHPNIRCGLLDLRHKFRNAL